MGKSCVEVRKMLKKEQPRYWTSGTWAIDFPFWVGKIIVRAKTTRPGAIVGWTCFYSLLSFVLVKDVGLRSNFVLTMARVQNASQELVTSWAGFPVDVQGGSVASAHASGWVDPSESPEAARQAVADNAELQRLLTAGAFDGTKTPKKKRGERLADSAPIQTGRISEADLPGSTPYTRGLNAGMIPDAGEYVEALVEGVRQWIPRMGQRERDRERGKLLRQ